MRFPIGTTQLVGNQLLRGFIIGNPQQSLCETHQHNAFLRRQVIFLHKCIE